MKQNNFKNKKKYLGIISVNSKGTGYVKIEGIKEDIEIDFKDLNTALNGDEVEVKLLAQKIKNRERQKGKVEKIIKREKESFVGILEKENNIFFVKPDDTKMYRDILIPKENLLGAKENQKVFAKIISWTEGEKSPIGKIEKILGKKGENEAEMHAIAIEKGFDHELSKETKEDAKKIKQMGLQKEDYKNRRDMRDILTFTIDPADAKDFDDALSFQKINENEFEIGIHIADVSHYVKEESHLDKEAKERATSVYLVDRTIPMLPEELSNDLCSLNPNVDRFTISAIFIMNKNGEIKNEWFGKTVIYSKKRFTYEEAEESIKDKTKPLHNELFILNNIAKKLTQERLKNGSISLEQEEVKFVLDEHSKPLKIIKKERQDSNKLIEEFMLLANKSVAKYVSKKIKNDGIFIYRIHDIPPKEKTEELALFLKNLGYKITLQNGIIPSFELEKIIKNIKDDDKRDTLHKRIIRSMAKAIYSTKNIGHYGLGFKYYTHFTSPIRRYPDLIVHRLLMEYLNGKRIQKEKWKDYEKIAIHSSLQEKKATEAERDSIKYKQVEYMSTHLGKTFKGIINGITAWGIYVEEIETKCEGLIKMKDMQDDFYIFDEEKIEIRGKRTKKKFKLGDRLNIKVFATDIEKKTIDYIPV